MVHSFGSKTGSIFRLASSALDAFEDELVPTPNLPDHLHAALYNGGIFNYSTMTTEIDIGKDLSLEGRNDLTADQKQQQAHKRKKEHAQTIANAVAGLLNIAVGDAGSQSHRFAGFSWIRDDKAYIGIAVGTPDQSQWMLPPLPRPEMKQAMRKIASDLFSEHAVQHVWQKEDADYIARLNATRPDDPTIRPLNADVHSRIFNLDDPRDAQMLELLKRVVKSGNHPNLVFSGAHEKEMTFVMNTTDLLQLQEKETRSFPGPGATAG